MPGVGVALVRILDVGVVVEVTTGITPLGASTMPMVPVEPDSVHPLVTLGPTRTARNRCPLRAFRPIRMPLTCTPFGAGRLSTPWSMSWSKTFGGGVTCTTNKAPNWRFCHL